MTSTSDNDTKGVITVGSNKVFEEWKLVYRLNSGSYEELEQGKTKTVNVVKNDLVEVKYIKDGETDVIKSVQATELKVGYILQYDTNGGTGGPSSVTQYDNATFTISSTVPTRTGYTFGGWGLTSNATESKYIGGDTYTGTNEITLYAIWYENIEYLESNGLQYIDTGYYPNQDTSVEFVAEALKATTAEPEGWFGSRYDTKSNSYTFWQSNTNNFKIVYANLDINTITNISMKLNNKYTIYQNKNITKINGTNYVTSEYSSFAPSATLTLFGVKTYEKSDYSSANSIDSRMAKLKLYSCKIWDNGTLIRDYHPVINSAGNPGLLDKVNMKIYYNAGTGSFIAGNN